MLYIYIYVQQRAPNKILVPVAHAHPVKQTNSENTTNV